MERTFLDTNVLLYADDADAKEKSVRARTCIADAVLEGKAVVSTQVLQEFFVIATRKLGLAAEDARARVEAFSQLDVVLLQPDLILSAIDLHRLHGLSFWDAMVVRAAAASGCSRLWSEDLQDGRTFDGVRIENPFLSDPLLTR
jgi:predicted nucleic acid-binding protein